MPHKTEHGAAAKNGQEQKKNRLGKIQEKHYGGGWHPPRFLLSPGDK